MKDRRKSGFQEIQDKRDKDHLRGERRESPPGSRKRKITPTSSEAPESPSITQNLIMGDFISDPFTCNLPDDDGNQCNKIFSGVENDVNGADSQANRKTHWQVHARHNHHNLGSGTFTTHQNLGHFTAIENTAGAPDSQSQGSATTPVAIAPAPPFGLGKPSFKRRKLSPTEEGLNDQPGENPATVTENTSKGSGLLSALWAKMGSFNRNFPIQNELSPSVEMSEDQPPSLTRDPPQHTPERIVSSPLDRPPSSPSPPPLHHLHFHRLKKTSKCLLLRHLYPRFHPQLLPRRFHCPLKIPMSQIFPTSHHSHPLTMASSNLLPWRLSRKPLCIWLMWGFV